MDSLATIQPGRLEGLNINGIHTFLGIPYAKPPVGPLLRLHHYGDLAMKSSGALAHPTGSTGLQVPLFNALLWSVADHRLLRCSRTLASS